MIVLGYRKQKIEKISYNQNPGLALISDWIISSGNTSLSVDLLVTYLEQLQRDDIVDIILKGQGQGLSKPVLFEIKPACCNIATNYSRSKDVGSTCAQDLFRCDVYTRLY